jgi:hypothetical protein
MEWLNATGHIDNVPTLTAIWKRQIHNKSLPINFKVCCCKNTARPNQASLPSL